MKIDKNLKAIQVNDTSEVYHANKEFVNNGSLKKILKSPATFYAEWTSTKEKESSKEMKFGSLAHKAILEGDDFLKKYVVKPEEFWGYTKKGERTNSKNCKEVQEAESQWLSEQPLGAIILTQQDFDNLKGMTKAIVNHKSAFNLLKEVVVENSIYYADPHYGVCLRARPDAFSKSLNALIDVKTALDCTREVFSRAMWNYRYDFQLAMYGEACEILHGDPIKFHAFIVVEKKEPYEVAVYVADKEVIETGKRAYKAAVQQLATCLQTNEWPGYQQTIENINLPVYAQSYEGL